MKIWKLVAGILSIILALFVAFQSMIAGMANTLSDNGEVGGTAGLLVAILMLTGGIVSIVVRNSTKTSGNIALIVLFLLAAVIGLTSAGSYGDLYIWSIWCLINCGLAVLTFIKIKKEN